LNTLIIGTLLALAALSFVLYPLISGELAPADPDVTPRDASDSSRNQAIDALREIEFDRATGKLSDTDYASLKASYTADAIQAMRNNSGSYCDRCGARPEPNAKFCSRCGSRLAGRD
jgi:ribosomal protein L40E